MDNVKQLLIKCLLEVKGEYLNKHAAEGICTLMRRQLNKVILGQGLFISPLIWQEFRETLFNPGDLTNMGWGYFNPCGSDGRSIPCIGIFDNIGIGAYWWPTTDYQSRIEMCAFLINYLNHNDYQSAYEIAIKRDLFGNFLYN